MADHIASCIWDMQILIHVSKTYILAYCCIRNFLTHLKRMLLNSYKKAEL